MAHKQVRLASILLIVWVSSGFASYTPATSYLIHTCNDAAYSTLCLQELFQYVDRIDGNPKKSTRLAIDAVRSELQVGSSAINNLAKQPHLRTFEMNSLNDCGTSIALTAMDVDAAYEATNHLGGGSKADKEDKRMNMEHQLKSVTSAVDECIKNLQGLNVRATMLKRAQEATTKLAQRATNAVDLIHRMQF